MTTVTVNKCIVDCSKPFDDLVYKNEGQFYLEEVFCSEYPSAKAGEGTVKSKENTAKRKAFKESLKLVGVEVNISSPATIWNKEKNETCVFSLVELVSYIRKSEDSLKLIFREKGSTADIPLTFEDEKRQNKLKLKSFIRLVHEVPSKGGKIKYKDIYNANVPLEFVHRVDNETGEFRRSVKSGYEKLLENGETYLDSRYRNYKGSKKGSTKKIPRQIIVAAGLRKILYGKNE